MPAKVNLTLWAPCADDAALPGSMDSVIDEACDEIGRTLGEVIPGALNISTLTFPEMRISNDVPLQGYCIMVAVRVQQDAISLEERIDLCEQVQNSTLGVLQPICRLTQVEALDAKFEPYGSVERLG